MKYISGIIAVPFFLTLGACSSSSNSTNDNTDNSNGTIRVANISGSTTDLSGVWRTACYTDNTDIMEQITVSGMTISYVNYSYSSSDGSCTGSQSNASSYSATIAVASSSSAITEWRNGMGASTTAPDAADGSGSLGDMTVFTNMAYTFTAINMPGGGPTVGSTTNFVNIIDDTGSATILYRGDYDDSSAQTSAYGGLADPFIRQ